MYSRISSAAIHGLEILLISVEADISDGLPAFIMVGYLSAQVREAEDRIRSSFRNNSLPFPAKRITVNLSPASVPKSGSLYDLPIALALLSSNAQIPPDALHEVLAVGELSLSGEINPVNGVLPIAVKAVQSGIRTMLVPSANAGECGNIPNLRIIGLHTLKEAVSFLRYGELPSASPAAEQPTDTTVNDAVDFRDIQGQALAQRAAEIAVAGFHNLLLAGPPGSGKTMIARRIPSILPSLTESEALEIAQIYSIAGLLDPLHPEIKNRPYRHPHHTISPQALAGGGRIPSPGEITLAHRGVLFLDEMPEFSKKALEILRQPLEDREIIISRSAGTFRFPANFLLLAAMNRCPCGLYPDLSRCTCSPQEISSYMNRISKPLLDRIDLTVQCKAVTYEELTAGKKGSQSSAEIRCRVEAVREIESRRFRDVPWHFNSEIPASAVRDFCRMDSRAEHTLAVFYELYSLSARSYHRAVKVARTIADLASSELIRSEHIEEALVFRAFDQPSPGQRVKPLIKSSFSGQERQINHGFR
ncbi:MAG: YifB family Mg chelatase-like AAA ATPase [Lachnospiraceae bacterium]|nr:YifB family Mg chelatase-like AAA ATPase [Lachnospiraceae bacterium]